MCINLLSCRLDELSSRNFVDPSDFLHSVQILCNWRLIYFSVVWMHFTSPVWLRLHSHAVPSEQFGQSGVSSVLNLMGLWSFLTLSIYDLNHKFFMGVIILRKFLLFLLGSQKVLFWYIRMIIWSLNFINMIYYISWFFKTLSQFIFLK